MKRIICGIVVLVVLTFCLWLFLRRSAPTPKQVMEPPKPSQPANTMVVPITSNTPAQTTPPQQTLVTNAFVRPDYIEEDQWNRLMLIRQLALSQNQPIEFYARVLDKNDQPVEGAKLQITLSRINEKMFETTNFFHMNMGDEIVHLSLNFVSDAAGWIKITNMTGKALWIDNLEMEGYTMPKYEGGVAYEPTGVRKPISDILMTNAWNPQKGYIFHLQKVEGK